MNGIQEVSGSIPLISTKRKLNAAVKIAALVFNARVKQTKNRGSIPLISTKRKLNAAVKSAALVFIYTS